jgi:multiple sugar transport system permease protein
MNQFENLDRGFDLLQERLPRGFQTYLPIAPVLLLVGLFILYPIFRAITSSFTDKSLLNPQDATYIGFENYSQILTNSEIQMVLINTLIWVSVGSAVAITLGFAMGWIMFEKLPYTALASAIVLVPWILPRVVGASIWKFMFSGSSGIINELLLQTGLIQEYQILLGNPDVSIWPPIVGMIWRLAPLFALLTLTSLKGIDSNLYEASSIDGANPWEQFRFITLPSMKYNLAIGFLLMLIYNIRNFSMVWVMTSGGPGYSSTTLPIMIYRAAFIDFDVGFASALSVGLFVVLLIFSYYYVKTYDKIREEF